MGQRRRPEASGTKGEGEIQKSRRDAGVTGQRAGRSDRSEVWGDSCCAEVNSLNSEGGFEGAETVLEVPLLCGSIAGF
jgi:hypothetical protein